MRTLPGLCCRTRARSYCEDILGIEQKFRQLSGQDPSPKEPSSVDLEMQADFGLAGVWAHGTEQRKIGTTGYRCRDSAAAAVAKDHLKANGKWNSSPEGLHAWLICRSGGWFKQGMQQGTIAACQHFKAGGAVPSSGRPTKQQ